MLLATHFLSEEVYLKASKKGVRTFLYNEINFIPPQNRKDQLFYNCNSERVAATWYAWSENERIINNFKNKFPEFFTIESYDITLAIKKAMYWSNFKTACLWYAVEQHFKEEKIYRIDAMHHMNKWGVILRYWKSKIKHRHKPGLKSSIQTNRIAIHLKNNFQMGIYQGIIHTIKTDHNYRIHIDRSVDPAFCEEYGLDQALYCQKTSFDAPLPGINLLNLNQEDLYVLGILVNSWNEFIHALDIAFQIYHQNLKTVLLNEAENGIYGAILSEVFCRQGVEVFNTMNGIKSGEAQDGFINFSKWFVWDKQMKNLLIEDNHLPSEKLIVSGHLIEDFIRDYHYKNSLDLDLELLKGKKVISLFSVKGRRVVKLETMKFLYDLLKKDKSYFLLIRRHPTEKPEEYILPEEDMENIRFVDYNQLNQNVTLHDQLFISDLSIVFGSTVALDSKWMGVPCISFEPREKSFIYSVDNEMIFHVKNVCELETCVLQFDFSRKGEKKAEAASVSDFIIKTLASA